MDAFMSTCRRGRKRHLCSLWGPRCLARLSYDVYFPIVLRNEIKPKRTTVEIETNSVTCTVVHFVLNLWSFGVLPNTQHKCFVSEKCMCILSQGQDMKRIWRSYPLTSVYVQTLYTYSKRWYKQLKTLSRAGNIPPHLTTKYLSCNGEKVSMR